MVITSLPPTSALMFLPFAIAIGIWVSWSDMKTMKIPNKAVLALLGSFLIVGLIALPLKAYAYALGLGVVILALGFVFNALGAFGAGDAKFAAAMAPFFIGADLRIVLGLFAACLLGAFATHRLMGLVPAFRRATPDWQSWTHKDFPMGLALSGTLILYLLAALLPLF